MEIQILFALVRYIINSHSEKETLILFNDYLLISACLVYTVCSILASKPLAVIEGMPPFEQIIMRLRCELTYTTKAHAGSSGNHWLWTSAISGLLISCNILVSTLLSNTIAEAILTSAQMGQNVCRLPKQLHSMWSWNISSRAAVVYFGGRWKGGHLDKQWLPIYIFKWATFKFTMPRWSQVDQEAKAIPSW